MVKQDLKVVPVEQVLKEQKVILATLAVRVELDLLVELAGLAGRVALVELERVRLDLLDLKVVPVELAGLVDKDQQAVPVAQAVPEESVQVRQVLPDQQEEQVELDLQVVQAELEL